MPPTGLTEEGGMTLSAEQQSIVHSSHNRTMMANIYID